MWDGWLVGFEFAVEKCLTSGKRRGGGGRTWTG